MNKTVIAFSLALFGVSAAQANACPAFSYNLMNGQTASADQVMANFNLVLGCVTNVESGNFPGNITLPATGNLLIGGSTAAGQNGLRLFSTDASGGGFIDARVSSADKGIVFRTDTGDASSERMRITAGGLVGIGTPAPADQLDIGGGILRANGIRGRAGLNGPVGSNVINLYWTGGAAQLWVDGTNIGSINTTSDRRLKHDVRSLDMALPILMRIRPVTFRWSDTGIFTDDGHDHQGFVADELETVIPSAINNGSNNQQIGRSKSYKTINYNEILPVLVKSIQEQQMEIDRLKAELRQGR